MKNVNSFAKLGVPINQWFIPTLYFQALELDNSFVLYSVKDTEYYLDSTNNLLKIKFFDKTKIGSISNLYVDSNTNKIYLRLKDGKYTEDGMRPSVGDFIYCDGLRFKINDIKGSYMLEDLELDLDNQEGFLSIYTSTKKTRLLNGSFAHYVNGVETWPWVNFYVDDIGDFCIKRYKSNNVADNYIDGEDIRSIVGKYI